MRCVKVLGQPLRRKMECYRHGRISNGKIMSSVSLEGERENHNKVKLKIMTISREICRKGSGRIQRVQLSSYLFRLRTK